MEDFNLHLTGDVHAIGAAHNLGRRVPRQPASTTSNPLGIDPHAILWPRVVDISDRALRHVVIGLGGRENGDPARDRVRDHGRARRSWRSSPSRPTCRTCAPGSAGSSWRRPTRRHAGHRRGPRRRRRDDRPARATRSSRTCSRRSRAARRSSTAGPFANIAHGNNSIIADRARARDERDRRAPRPASAPTWAPRSSSTSSAARRACARTRPSSSPRSGRSRCTAASARSSPASRSTRRCSRRTSRRSGPAPRTSPKQIENVTMFGVPAVVAINSLPDRHAGRGRGDPRGRPGGRRPRRGRRDALRRRRQRRRRPRRGGLGGGRRAARRTSSCSTRTTLPLGREDRDDRDAGLRRATASSCLPAAREVAQAVRGPGLRAACRSAWPRRSTRSATTRALKGRPTGFTRPDPRDPAVGRRRVHHAARAARCGRCPGCRRDRAARRSTSTRTGTSSGCSEPRPGRRAPAPRPGRARSSRATRQTDDHEPGAIAEQERAPRPRRRSGRAPRRPMGVVVVAVVVAVVVGRVVLDRDVARVMQPRATDRGRRCVRHRGRHLRRHSRT